MASLGWTDPKVEEDDLNYVEWGDTDKILYAHYDKKERELMIQTMVYLRDDSPTLSTDNQTAGRR